MISRFARRSPTTGKVATLPIALALFAFARPSLADGTTTDPCAAPAGHYLMAPTGTTLHMLATCHEQQGKTASAWAEYLEASTMAQHEKHVDIATSARRRASAIESRLSTLAVRVAPGVGDLPGLDVRRDGIPLEHAAWGTAAPVDPGEHSVEATAPGKLPWRRTVIIRPGATAQNVEVGPLEDAPSHAAVGITTLTSATTASAADEDHRIEPSRPGTAQRRVGLVIAGLGLASVGVGTYFGIRTLDKSDSARRACPTTPCSDRAAVDANDQAKSSATISTATLAAGGGLLLLGSILFFTAPSSVAPKRDATTSRKPTFDIATSPAFAGLRVSGGF